MTEETKALAPTLPYVKADPTIGQAKIVLWSGGYILAVLLVAALISHPGQTPSDPDGTVAGVTSQPKMTSPPKVASATEGRQTAASVSSPKTDGKRWSPHRLEPVNKAGVVMTKSWMRLGPGQEYGGIITLPEGTAVQVDGRVRDRKGSFWYLLHSEKGKGYVHGDLVALK